MTVYVAATDHVDTSARLCDYLLDRITASDAVHVVNSLPDGDAVDNRDVRDGEEALNVVFSRLGALATVETHQFRGNEPHEDVLGLADDVDADELVIGLRTRDSTGDDGISSTLAAVLGRTERPVTVVPLANGE